jgi:hypothetical protein
LTSRTRADASTNAPVTSSTRSDSPRAVRFSSSPVARSSIPVLDDSSTDSDNDADCDAIPATASRSSSTDPRADATPPT